MPACLEPNVKFAIVLEFDKDKPKETQPAFFVRALSSRAQGKLSDDVDAAIRHETTQEIRQATKDLLLQNVTGWVNMGDYKFPDDIDDVCSVQDMREILFKLLASSYVQYEEKKS